MVEMVFCSYDLCFGWATRPSAAELEISIRTSEGRMVDLIEQYCRLSPLSTDRRVAQSVLGTAQSVARLTFSYENDRHWPW